MGHTMKKTCEQTILMRMPILARLKTSLREVDRTLTSYPHFKAIRRGTILKYALKLGSTVNSVYGIELSKEGIIFDIRSNESPLYDMRSALNISMGVCAILKNHYEVRLDSMYPYIAYEMNKAAIERHSSITTKDMKRNYSDIILAKRINELRRRNAELELEISNTYDTLVDITSGILISEGLNRTAAFSDAFLKYGIDNKYLDAAISRVGSRGYKLTLIEKDRFSVVSI